MEHIFTKDHFSLKNLPLRVDNPIVFVVSQWQVNKFQPGFPYLLYRSIPAVFFVTTWFIRLGAPSWPIYLSMWGYTLCTLQALIGFLLSLVTFICMAVLKKVDIARTILRVYPLYWFINVTATTMGFVISTVHWCILAKGKMSTIMVFFIHAVNSIYLMIDLCLASHPVRVIHALYPLAVGMIYVIFGICYHFYDKNREGLGYVYSIIDWDYPLSTMLAVVIIAILITFFHVLTFAVYLCKLRLYRRIFGRNDPHVATPQTYSVS